MNLARLISETAAKYADKPAIIFEGKIWSYRDFEHQILNYAAIIQHLGIKKGDRVTVQLPKCIEFLFLHFAILSIGAIVLPLNPDYRPEEVRYFLTDSGSSLLVTNSSLYNKVQAELKHLSALQILHTENIPTFPIAEFIPEYAAGDDDIAMICYTSGTTGRSKGAAISHRNLIMNMKSLHQAWAWSDRDIL
ncbi:MAG: acyl--CoA ligase, partial [Pseudanabaena sp. M135S2SP2A07QC]|nr:acyl--CoA ligase [Pseudanabaena sp. M135S2SP2A07QC]